MELVIIYSSLVLFAVGLGWWLGHRGHPDREVLKQLINMSRLLVTKELVGELSQDPYARRIALAKNLMPCDGPPEPTENDTALPAKIASPPSETRATVSILEDMGVLEVPPQE